MRALITGGAGFIGSHLADELLSQGDEVWVVDDLSTGSIENIDHLRDNSRFHYQTLDIRKAGEFAELVDRCDVIFHLAAAVGVRLIVEKPVRTIETNVRGTEVVLEMAAKKSKLVVIASTSEVYGKSKRLPFCEDDDLLIGPSCRSRWAYACSKALDEFLALAYWKERRLPVIVVRFFNTVGPRQTGRYGMVLPNFVRQALANEPITVYGSGKQSRCFTFVGDVVKALRKLVCTQGACGEVFNLGSNVPVTIEELAHKVRALTGSRSDVVYVPYEQAYEEGFEDMMARVPSLDKAAKWIGYRPTTSLQEAIEAVIAYERGRLARSGVGHSTDAIAATA